MSKEEAIQKFLELCDTLKMNNLEIAKVLGIHRRTYYRYASGDTKIPYSVIKVLELLCEQKAASISE